MPTYAYTCKNCNESFDKYQRFDEPSLTECPSCHSNTLRKIWGAVGGVQFKGSGFYSTDSSSSSTPSE